ncbi:hypothetical protein AVEN_97597-1, partial [Araneus ventricosus]
MCMLSGIWVSAFALSARLGGRFSPPAGLLLSPLSYFQVLNPVGQAGEG